jgi:hypothetical protein
MGTGDYTNRRCKLDNGKIRLFESALPLGSHLYDDLKSGGKPVFRHIGDGYIFSVNGKPLTSERKWSFYRKNQL